MSKRIFKEIIKNTTKPNAHKTHKTHKTNNNTQYIRDNLTPMKVKTPISWTTPKHKRFIRSSWVNKVN